MVAIKVGIKDGFFLRSLSHPGVSRVMPMSPAKQSSSGEFEGNIATPPPRTPPIWTRTLNATGDH